MKNTEQVTDYEKQAQDFLTKTGTTCKIEFFKHGKHWEDDKDDRDIYKVTLTKGGRLFSFKFGNSIIASHKYTGLTPYGKKMIQNNPSFDDKQLRIICQLKNFDFKINHNYGKPSEYDILACLTKYEPGTFEDFCSDYGYDTDSRKAENTYNAVQEEYMNISRLFSEDELELMREIQ